MNVTPGTKYYYLVRSQIGGVYNGNWSPTVNNITIPLEPMAVTINSLSYANGAVAISWDAPPAADGYKVYRKVAGGSWTTIKKNTTETSFTDTNVTAGTKYYYVVRSHIGGVYNTGWTATVQSITIPASAPQPVTITSLQSLASQLAVVVTWEDIPGMDGYRVYRKAPGGRWTGLANTKGTSYTDENVQYGVTYQYAVRSKLNGVYNDGWTATIKSITVN